MSDDLYTNVPIVVKHIGETSVETGPDGNKVSIDLPGHVIIGANVGGAFFPLTKMGKARFDKHLAKAQANQPAPSDPPPAEQG